MTKLMHSTSFRLVLIYMVVFGASVLLLLGFLYWFTAGYMARQADAAIQAEIELLAERYRTRELPGLTAMIQERMRSHPDRSNIYLLADPLRRPMVGNLEKWPDATEGPGGWLEFRVTQQGGAEESHQARARSFRLRERYWLLVGRDMHELTQVRSLMHEAFAWAAGLTLLLALAGGYALSRTVTRRLDVINETSREIMSGQLSRRIPLRGDDEFDELASHLNAMLDRIEALMNDVRRVSDNIAHDLKTPLTRLRNELESIHGGVGDDRSVERALQEADNLLATFNALLRIARIESGRRRAGFTEVDLTGLCRDVVELYQPLAEDKGLALSDRVEDDITVHGDRDLLFQAVANLLDNAIKYTPAPGEISLSLQPGGDAARITVCDSGPGIPEAVHDKVFERFYRTEDSRHSPGSGLGLSLVKAVVEVHEGRITLDDNDPGLRVELELPLTCQA
ncbi:MAG: HAMP domain-containing sensor histidine kinase [Gammaproteobacteria bacterium]|nr:HAMP domain-containing sensor histidine kinase [Gammaproteobacteria bacterium]